MADTDIVERRMRNRAATIYAGFPQWSDTAALLERAADEITRLRALNVDLLKALTALEAFVGVMFGAGPDAVIPETVRTPIGIDVKAGEIIRAAAAAIAKAKGR